ncbi:hypothetical protein LINPERPRIM_LOCUS15083 [Linum perenne]
MKKMMKFTSESIEHLLHHVGWRKIQRLG